MRLEIRNGRVAYTERPELKGKTYHEFLEWASEQHRPIEIVGSSWHTCVDWSREICPACEAPKYRPDGWYQIGPPALWWPDANGK